MLDIISEVNTFLLTQITPYAPIRQNVFMFESAEEILCRQEPSQAVETRYLDGKRSGVLNFAYYTKSLSQITARQQLDDIINALDFKGIKELTGGLFVNIEVVTLPAFVQKTEIGEYIFTAALKLNYIGG